MFFIKVPLDFWDNPKVYGVREDFPELCDAIFISLFRLWSFCRSKQSDGAFDTATRVERAAHWHGERGKFIAVLTGDETRFLDKVQNGYQIHNWYKNNPDLDPKKRADVSGKRQMAAHSRYHKQDIDTLLKNRVTDFIKVPWFSDSLKNGRITVQTTKVPKYVRICGQEFYGYRELKQYLTHICETSREKGALLGALKTHTKKCRCGKYFINEKPRSKCGDC